MKIHIVQPDDTLIKIASEYGVDIEILCNSNPNLSDSTPLVMGTKIKIPTQGVRVSKKSSQQLEHPLQVAGYSIDPHPPMPKWWYEEGSLEGVGQEREEHFDFNAMQDDLLQQSPVDTYMDQSYLDYHVIPDRSEVDREQRPMEQYSQPNSYQGYYGELPIDPYGYYPQYDDISGYGYYPQYDTISGYGNYPAFPLANNYGYTSWTWPTYPFHIFNTNRIPIPPRFVNVNGSRRFKFPVPFFNMDEWTEEFDQELSDI